MLNEYLHKALKKAEYKILEDGNWFASIPGFQGVWASCSSIEETREELLEVLEEWVLLKLKAGDEVPEIEGSSLEFLLEAG